MDLPPNHHVVCACQSPGPSQLLPTCAGVFHRPACTHTHPGAPYDGLKRRGRSKTTREDTSCWPASKKTLASDNHQLSKIISAPCAEVTFPIPPRGARVWAPSSAHTASRGSLSLVPPLITALITRRDASSSARVRQEVLGNRLRPSSRRTIRPALRCRWAGPAGMSGVRGRDGTR